MRIFRAVGPPIIFECSTNTFFRTTCIFKRNNFSNTLNVVNHQWKVPVAKWAQILAWNISSPFHFLGLQDELSTIHDLVYGAAHLALDFADSETTFALDITFDTPNFSCQLMRMFNNVRAQYMQSVTVVLAFSYLPTYTHAYICLYVHTYIHACIYILCYIHKYIHAYFSPVYTYINKGGVSML